MDQKEFIIMLVTRSMALEIAVERGFIAREELPNLCAEAGKFLGKYHDQGKAWNDFQAALGAGVFRERQGTPLLRKK